MFEAEAEAEVDVDVEAEADVCGGVLLRPCGEFCPCVSPAISSLDFANILT